MMQKVSKFVEYRLHFPMSEQGWTIFHRRRKVAANETGVRLEAASVRDSSDERIHPRAAALAFPRIPIGVECANQAAALRPIVVVDLVILYFGMPYRNARLFHHTNTVQPLHDLEHPLHHAIQWKV